MLSDNFAVDLPPEEIAAILGVPARQAYPAGYGPRAPRSRRGAMSSVSAAANGPIQVTIQCVNFDWQRIAFIGLALAAGIGLGWLFASAMTKAAVTKAALAAAL